MTQPAPELKQHGAGAGRSWRDKIQRLRLLPDNPEIGRAPYFWLIYLGFFVAPYLDERPTPADLALAVAVIFVFLLLYFRSYWLVGIARWTNALAMTALGAMTAPINPGAAVFFIYSACASAGFERAGEGAALIAANVVFGLITAAVLHLSTSFMVGVVLFPIVIGGSALYSSQIGRARSRLLRKQDEVEYLSKIAERERIARDMHDVLGHSLSVVVLKSELAQRLLATDPVRAAQELHDIEHAARQALAQVRETISGYRSAGWPAELMQARKLLTQAGIAFELDRASTSITVPLPAELENVLSLALREAVTNILRHAGATRCRVALHCERTEWRCQIDDDGVGLSTLRPGSGLTGMRERVEGLGGQLLLADNRPGLSLQLTFAR
ncbi:MAG: sensor histidine kinase [Pseudomonadota bacterium]|nr:sensor histidine kinase [Pseudomonadota bacterium]